MHRTALTLSLVAVCALSLVARQAPPAGTPPRAYGTMNQLMRGVLYPAANVVFFAQAEDPATVKPAVVLDPSMATDPLFNAFGGWQAVENAALALAETASLMSIPGRVCSTGLPAPVANAEWEKFVQQVRDASMKAYAAAQTKSQERIIAISEELSASCSNCHRRFRDRRAIPRCSPEAAPARGK